jgi:Fe-S-cluster containining protein
VEGNVREDGFQCRQCGHCCIHVSGAFSACATVADIARWEAAGREDILAWVDRIEVGDACVYDLWIDPETGEDVSQCPWLEQVPGTDRYVCRIHDLKPDHCRKYPTSRRHSEETGCPGFGRSGERDRREPGSRRL